MLMESRDLWSESGFRSMYYVNETVNAKSLSVAYSLPVDYMLSV